MSNDPSGNNPYSVTPSQNPAFQNTASGMPGPPGGMGHGVPAGMDQAAVTKVEAIIKDAGQFWLAILLCIFCSALGMILIIPWYLVRLLQWNSLAQAYPALLAPDAPVASLAKRFQSSKWKLVTALILGVLLVFFLAGLWYFILSNPPAGRR